MKAVRYILSNPLGWAITLIHWLVVAFAYLGDTPTHPARFGTHGTTELMGILVYFNMPALVVSKLLLTPFGLPMTPYIILLVLSITVQWLLIGSFSHWYYSLIRPTNRDGLHLR